MIACTAALLVAALLLVLLLCCCPATATTAHSSSCFFSLARKRGIHHGAAAPPPPPPGREDNNLDRRLLVLWLRAGAASSAESSTAAETDSESNASSSSRPPIQSWTDTGLEMAPPDPILGVAQNYRDCQRADKVNLVIGAYRDAHGSPWILPSVQAAEARLLQRQSEQPSAVNHEYLPIDGDADFIEQAVRFAYGDQLCADRHIAAVQTLSGTGACRVGGQFLKLALPNATQIYLPVPTWGNHRQIFRHCGFADPQPYRYYDSSTNRLDFDGLLADLEAAPAGSVILLHACAHNPTGCDPTREQWQTIAELLASKRHIAFFDSAYQGFASGDADRDAWALRHVVARGDVPVLLAQSFAKNFGLYGERCGTLSVVCRDNADEQAVVLSQLKGIIRPMYSSPPKHGSGIVKTILGDAELAERYRAECRTMADRIGAMRHRLVEELEQAGSTHDWSHVLAQIGMFAYTGLSAGMVDELTDEYAIFLTRNGRISLAGLNEDNVARVAQAVHAVTNGRSITTST